MTCPSASYINQNYDLVRGEILVLMGAREKNVYVNNSIQKYNDLHYIGMRCRPDIADIIREDMFYFDITVSIQHKTLSSIHKIIDTKYT